MAIPYTSSQGVSYGSAGQPVNFNPVIDTTQAEDAINKARTTLDEAKNQMSQQQNQQSIQPSSQFGGYQSMQDWQRAYDISRQPGYTGKTISKPTLSEYQKIAARQGKEGFDILGGTLGQEIGKTPTEIAIYSYKHPDGTITYHDEQGNQLSEIAQGTTAIPLNFQPSSQTGQTVTQQALQSQLTDVGTKIDLTINSAQQDLQSLRSGTFPLTPAQQAQINATNAQFDQLRQIQQTANQQYQNAITQSGISTGRSMYAPEIAAGEIASAVNSGIQKIADIDTKRAATIAQMEDALQSDNYKLIDQAYTNYTNLLKQKQDEIQKQYDNVSKAIKDAQDYTVKITQQVLESDKFTWQQKQDLVDNALKQAQLDETQRKNLSDEAFKQKQLDATNYANNLLAGIITNKTMTDSSGNPLPSSQEQMIQEWRNKGVSDTSITQIKGIADYSINPASFSTSAKQSQGGFTRAQIVAMAKQYDPTYDEKQYAARQKFLTNWTAGGQNSVTVAANTAIQHLGELKSQADALANLNKGSLGPFTTKYNTTIQWLNESFGNPEVLKYKQTAAALAGELAKIYKNSIGSSAAPTDDEIKYQLEILTTGVTPQQANALIENATNLMTDRLTSAVENYQMQMGKMPTSILTPSAKETIQKLQESGLNIDTSKIDYNPYSSMSDEDLLSGTVNKGSSASADTTTYFNSIMNNISNINNF